MKTVLEKNLLDLTNNLINDTEYSVEQNEAFTVENASKVTKGLKGLELENYRTAILPDD